MRPVRVPARLSWMPGLRMGHTPADPVNGRPAAFVEVNEPAGQGLIFGTLKDGQEPAEVVESVLLDTALDQYYPKSTRLHFLHLPG